MMQKALINLTGSGGLAMMAFGLWQYSPAFSLTIVGAILFLMAIAALAISARKRPPDSW